MTLSAALASALLVVSRRRWLVLAVVLVLGGGISALIALGPSRYAARTSLLAKFGREYTLKSDNGSAVAPTNFGQDEIVNSVVEIMRSDSLVDEVVAQVGVSVLYPDIAALAPTGTTPEKAAAARLAGDLTVSPSRRSNVVVAELVNTDPRVAAYALNTFVDAFQTKWLSLYGETRTPFLKRELDLVRESLAKASMAVTAFEQAHGTFNKSGQLDRLLRDREDLQRTYTRVAACCSGSDGAKDLEGQLANLDGRIGALNAGQAQLRNLVREQELAQEAVDAADRRLQDARNSVAMDRNRMTSVQVIEPAVPPTRPARPGKATKIALVLLFSGVIGVAAAALAEALRRRFSTAAELRRAFHPVPVLADVPQWNPSAGA